MSLPTCSCGRADNHVVARATTFDGSSVSRWHDGSITGALGLWPRGIGRSRFGWQQRAAAELLWPNVSLYDYAELPQLIRLARRAVVQKSLLPHEYLRRALAGETFRRAGKAVLTARSAPIAP